MTLPQASWPAMIAPPLGENTSELMSPAGVVRSTSAWVATL